MEEAAAQPQQKCVDDYSNLKAAMIQSSSSSPSSTSTMIRNSQHDEDNAAAAAAADNSTNNSGSPTLIQLCAQATIEVTGRNAELDMTDMAFVLTCAVTGTCLITASNSNNSSSSSRNHRLFYGAPKIAVFEGIQFSGGKVWSGGGGAFLITGGTVEFRNAVFTNNRAFRGGAIMIEGEDSSSAQVTIEDSVFNDNESRGAGGSIYARGGGISGSQQQQRAALTSVTISRSTFRGSHAQVDGGAVYFIGSGTMANLSNSTFTNCSASVDGGAVYVIGGAAANLFQCTFRGNRASVFAGALCVASVRGRPSRAVVQASTFIDNSARVGGGAIALLAAAELTLAASSSSAATVFAENSAAKGSDLFMLGGPRVETVVCQENSAIFCNGPALQKRKTGCEAAAFVGTTGAGLCP